MAILETAAECIIKIDNKELKSTVSGVQLDQYIDDHHETLIRIQQVGKAQNDKDFDDPGNYTSFLGKSISVNIRPVGDVVDPGRELEFVGVVTEVQLDNSIDGLNTVLITACSPTVKMDGAARNAHYFDMSASDIIGKIVQSYPITVGTIDSTEGKYKFDTQYRETDYDYIMRLANASGMFAYYNGKEFNLTKAGQGNKTELVWRETLGSFKMGLGTAPMEFTAKVYNYEQSKVYAQDSKQLGSKAALSFLSKVSPEASKEIYKDSAYSNAPKSAADARSLDQTLENEKNRAMGDMVKCVGQSIAPDVAIGNCLKIVGMDKLDGEYWAKAVRHVFDESGKYHNVFVCSPCDIAFPSKRPATESMAVEEKSMTSQTTVPKATREEVKFIGLHVATVVDNNDPDKLGRIKVKYPWSEQETTDWVRLAVPYAGKDRGWVALPEIDDEVLIGYEHGDTDHPIALGALYNKDNAPPQAGGDENELKVFVSRSGNKIEFLDKDGSEQILISNKDGKNQIVMDVSGPSITIKSEGDITVEGTGNLTVQGANISFKSDKKVEIEAGSDLNIKGINVNIEASANLKSKAGAMHNVEGTTVTVKGTPIQLN